MNLKKQTVAVTIAGWSLMFPGKRGPDELEFLSVKFFGSLKNTYNDKTFKIAADMVERETAFFPTIKSMLDVRNSVYQKTDALIDHMQKALPESTDNSLTPQEIANNKKKDTDNI